MLASHTSLSVACCLSAHLPTAPMAPQVGTQVLLILIFVHFLGAHQNASTSANLLKEPFQLLLQSEEDVKYLIAQGRKKTSNIIKPYRFQRFALPTGQYRLHCKLVYNWINTSNHDWVVEYSSVTNLVASTLAEQQGGQPEDLVCYFVDAANQVEANCLLELMKNHTIPFPKVERLTRLANSTSTNSTPTAYQPPSQTYCNAEGHPMPVTSHHTSLWVIFLIAIVVIIRILLIIELYKHGTANLVRVRRYFQHWNIRLFTNTFYIGHNLY